MSAKQHFDIVIAGSGLVGLATAAMLSAADSALSIVVADAPIVPDQPDPLRCGLRVSALTPATINRFESLSIWEQLPTTHYDYFSTMRVWDAGVSFGEGVMFDAASLGHGQLGAIIDNAMLRWQLYQFLTTNTDVAFIPVRVAGVQASIDKVSVDLDDGQRLSSRLLVGADGRNSGVRKLSGIPVKAWAHEQRAIVAQLQPDISHEHCALQRFLPQGPLALLPLPEGLVSLVWSTTPSQADELLEMDEHAFSQAVTHASDEILGDLRLVTKRAAFPLISQYAADPVASRVVLVGDAAHAIHPLAGQGVNLGFSDAAVLAAIAASARHADIGDAPWLRRYRRRRKADNLTTLYGLDLLNRLFAREDGVVADVRRRGMQAFQRSAWAKRLAGGHAMGDALGLVRARDGVS